MKNLSRVIKNVATIIIKVLHRLFSLALAARAQMLANMHAFIIYSIWQRQRVQVWTTEL